MDAIRLVCPECDAVHRVKNITLGKLYRCKKCKTGLITMQPSVLVCPACGATRPPAHIEVSRLVTCDECEQMPLMNVRIAGILHSGQVTNSDIEDEQPPLLENIMMPAAVATATPHLPATATPTLSPSSTTETEKTPPELSTPEAEKIPGIDTVIIRKLIAENANNASTLLDDLPTSNPPSPNPDDEPEFITTESPNAETTAPRHEISSRPSTSAEAALSLDENLLRELKFLTARSPRTPLIVWGCLALLLILYGWLLSSRDAQNITLQETQKRLHATEQRMQKNFEEMFKLSQTRIADLEAKIKTLSAEKRLLEADLQEYHRKMSMMQKAYNRQFGIEGDGVELPNK